MKNLDNTFTERLWRSLKQEAIYLEDIQRRLAGAGRARSVQLHTLNCLVQKGSGRLGISSRR